MTNELMRLINNYNIKENPMDFTSKKDKRVVFVEYTEDDIVDRISSVCSTITEVVDYVLYKEYKQYRFIIYSD